MSWIWTELPIVVPGKGYVTPVQVKGSNGQNLDRKINLGCIELTALAPFL